VQKLKELIKTQIIPFTLLFIIMFIPLVERIVTNKYTLVFRLFGLHPI
jgi:hypothetical protein